MKPGCVYLVGAGCGRADLLTLRGKARLERCDAVVYDDLIDPAILDFAPPTAERIYMGKRAGSHSAAQTEISAKLVELAAQGNVVVRLKGGDPFLFGRGGEEILALKEAGISFEEVPGIPSAIAIPAAAGIPVTHRGLSRSLHIITGHTADTPDGLPLHLEELARCEGTLVFLMGLGKLPLIVRRLMECGRNPATPAAVLSGGNSPNPATVRGTLADIAEQAAHVRPPAVIVVGDVAGLDLTSTLPAPLAGVRVGLVGTRAVTDKLAAGLGNLGAETVCVCRLVPVELPLDFDWARLSSPASKWVVLTSVNGVEIFFRKLRTAGVDLRQLHACRFAVIGEATQTALAAHGITADLCPEHFTSMALAEALTKTANPEDEIFLFRCARGAAILAHLPRAVDLHTYDLVRDDRLPTADLDRLDYLTLCSAGGVKEFFARYGTCPSHVRCVCIGEATAREWAKHSGQMARIAKNISTESIIQLILNDMK